MDRFQILKKKMYDGTTSVSINTHTIFDSYLECKLPDGYHFIPGWSSVDGYDNIISDEGQMITLTGLYFDEEKQLPYHLTDDSEKFYFEVLEEVEL